MKNIYTTLLAGAALVLTTGASAQHAAKGASRHAMATQSIRPTTYHNDLRGGNPVNDECDAAVNQDLAIGGSVTFTGDNTGATDSQGADSLGVPQVWETFTTTECANLQLTYCGTNPAFGNALLALFVDCPFSDFIPSSDFDQTTCSDGNVTIFYNEVPAGQYYYAVMLDPANGAEGAYTITVSASACTPPPPPPANDDCAGVVSLPVNSWCNFQYFTGAGATETLPADSCNGFLGSAEDDVWFSFVATATDLTIAVQGNDDGDGDNATGYDAVMELFATCGSGSPLTCSDGSLGSELEQIDATGLTVGTTYYVRVFDWYDGLWPDHAFGICVSTSSDVNIGMEENSTSAFSLYPNPGTGVFNLQYSGKNGLANIEVFDVTGRIVYNTQAQVATGSTSSMDLTGLVAGNYNVRLTVGDVRTEQRLMVK